MTAELSLMGLSPVLPDRNRNCQRNRVRRGGVEINPFLDLADRQISAPRKTRLRAVENRAARQAAEREQLAAAWRQWHCERRAALLAGPHGEAVGRLIGFLDSMTLDQGAALISLVEAGPWRHADRDTRFEVLALIDTAIIGLRERHGFPAFDDPIGDRANVFLLIREALL
jgi:hypothetical protein